MADLLKMHVDTSPLGQDIMFALWAINNSIKYQNKPCIFISMYIYTENELRFLIVSNNVIALRWQLVDSAGEGSRSRTCIE